MEPMPSSEPTAPAPLTRRTDPALADRSWMRSRRVQTFGLGALCGALGLSLVVVVTTILGASQTPAPLVPADPAPVSEPRPSASVPAKPAPPPSSTPTVEPVEQTDTATEPEDTVQEPVAADPAPAPAPTATPSAEETADSPGNSANAPGQQKKP